VKKLDINETIQTIANVGVVLGIIFLALEIQQNTNAVRSSVIQALSEQTYESVRIAIENPEVRETIFASQNGTLTDDQKQLMDLLYESTLRVRQNRYLQDRLGVLDVDISSELGNGGIYRTADFRRFWSERGETFSPGFQEYVRRELLPLSEHLQ